MYSALGATVHTHKFRAGERRGRLWEGKNTYAFFLDVYDTVWRNGLWDKMWELGVRGLIMWRVIKELYRVSRSAVLLDGECSEAFDVQQGVAQGYSFSPISFYQWPFEGSGTSRARGGTK